MKKKIGRPNQQVKKLCALDSCRKEFSVPPSGSSQQCCSKEHAHQYKTFLYEKKRLDGKGHWFINDHGYKMVGVPGGSFRLEHRVIIEKHIGRRLRRDEVIHHINKDTLDNSIDNLQILSPTEHGKLHGQEQQRDPTKWTTITCLNCGKESEKQKTHVSEHPNTFCDRKCYIEGCSEVIISNRADYKNRYKFPKGRRPGKWAQVKCASCGTVLNRLVSQVPTSGRCFCDRLCASSFKYPLNTKRKKAEYVTLTCYFCGESFKRMKSVYKPDKKCFCNNACTGRYLKGRPLNER